MDAVARHRLEIMSVELDKITRRILALLQQNNQLTSEEIGEAVGISASTVQRRIKYLRESKIIERDVSILSPELLGRRLMAVIQIEMERENPNVLGELKKAMSGRPEVMQCYYVTGEADFIAIVTFADMLEFEKFCEEHLLGNKNIKRFHTSVVVSRVKVGLAVPI